VVAGEFGNATPIGAALTATGYEVVWQFTGTNTYTVWNTDSSGNFVSDTIGAVPGTSTTLEALETSFHQDLNGDGVIGVLIQTDTNSFGTTSLTEVGINYYLENSSGAGPELKYSGAPVVAGQFGNATLIGAALTATGYEVAWQFAGSNNFTVWNTDSSGNFVSDTIGVVSGNSATLEALETSFHQDLNGDGVIGYPVIQTDTNSFGTTSLTEVGINYYLENSSGAGPELKYSGAPVVAGEFGNATLIGAALTATGYEVVWQFAGTNNYTVWNTDSSGNFVSDTIGVVPGTSATLEALETTFNQDLNGDGTIGNPTTGQVTATAALANPTPDNFHFVSDGGETPQAIAFSTHPSSAAGQTNTPSTTPAMTGHDSLVFDSTLARGLNAGPAMNDANAGNSSFANIHAALNGAHHDAFNNAAAHDATHGAQWLTHHDFHLI
jgi:hypothetical protein